MSTRPGILAAPRARHEEYVGLDGLRALQDAAFLSAPDPEQFRGEITRLSFDHVEIITVAATAHTFQRPARLAREIDDAAALTMVVNGSISVHRLGARYELKRRQVSITRSTDPFAYTATGPVLLVQGLVGARYFPRSLIDSAHLPAGPLTRTALVDTFVSFIEQLAAFPPDRPTAQSGYIGRALADLMSAVLTEQGVHTTRQSGAESIRFRTRDYIERHLFDQSLSPATIAAELGVSVRYVHHAFNGEDESISRYIRRLRTTAVAASVQHAAAAGERAEGRQELARRFGFTGPDQLARHFSAQFGMTIEEYSELGDQPIGVDDS
jgi:AraC-like DNA-binding protein